MQSFNNRFLIYFCSTVYFVVSYEYNHNTTANVQVIDALRANNLNYSDPCNNFWLHACGAWNSQSPDTFDVIERSYAKNMQNLLQAQHVVAASPLLHKLRNYFSACEQLQNQTPTLYGYYKELVELQRALQVLTAKSWSTYDWYIIAELRRYGVNDIFLHEAVGNVNFDATLQVVQISMPSTEHSFESKHEILSYLQAFLPHTERNMATAVFDFELKIKALTRQQLNRNNKGEQLLNLAELKEYFPFIDWQLYFNTLLQQPANEKFLISIADADYMNDLVLLLADTPTVTIANYIWAKVGRFLYNVRPEGSGNFCIKHMAVTLPLGLDFVYDKYFYAQQRQIDEVILAEILQNLKKQFELNLKNAANLQLNVKQLNFIKAKLNSLTLRVANLPLNMSGNFYEHYYDGISINVSNFYQNHWTMLQFRTLQQHLPLLAGYQQERVTLAEYVVNDDITQARNAPYYVQTRNLLIVPMVFLQLPFYHATLHPLLQYSLLGWMLAHELHHAFDADGILLDALGKQSYVGASIRESAVYQQSLRCLNGQVPAPASLAERMADVSGLQLAYDTYFTKAARPAGILTVPYSTKQLFFLNFAQIFCGSLPTAIQHDRDDVRVILAVANMPQFAAAFQCAKGARENPNTHCQMWR